jgi:chromosome partitioning protein
VAKIICVAGQKGGVGKTTTALNLGYTLSRVGSRVLLVDGDPQAGMTLATSLRARTEKGLIDVLRGDLAPADVVVKTRDESLSVAGIGDLEPEDVFLLEDDRQRERMAAAIRELASGYDFVFLDAPAGVGGLVATWLSAADSVMLVVTPRLLSLTSLPPFLGLLLWIQEHRNPRLALEGVLITMHDAGNASENEIIGELRGAFPAGSVFRVTIPADENFEVASERSLPVALLPGGAPLARPYLELAVELKSRELAGTAGSSDEPVRGLF